MPTVSVNPVAVEVEMVAYKGYRLPKSIADKCDDAGHFIRCAQVYADVQRQLAKGDGAPVQVKVRNPGNTYRMVRGRVKRV